ncbi:MAG: glycosyltransferase family 39 protein [Acidobacteriota bacterium]|nr:glycosyltransferase family 39 protein [Acidobacteriota bacterium]
MNDRETTAKSGWPGRWELIALCGLAVALVLTNPHFTFLDDETNIIYGAARSAAQILAAFLHGRGMHEHPPLYDLLLHGWLRLTGEKQWALRIPSILFYVSGIGALALAATDVACKRAGRALIWIAVLWPYGFHYGRLAAWYSFCFLMVALATLAYLRVLRSPIGGNWLFLAASSLALVWANYFGWALVACLVVDFLLRRRRDPRLPRWPLAGIAAVLALAYLPLARAFWDELMTHPTEGGHSPVARFLYGIYGLYTLAVSESVAPWFWRLGIPAALATAALLLALATARQPGRRFFVYFCALFALMTLGGILTTKRLLLIAPWLLLPAATLAGFESRPPEAPASRSQNGNRKFLLGSLAVAFAIGWFGILFPRHYAAPRFIEPWPQAGREAAGALSRGGIVIGNSPSFFFYLGYAIAARQDHELRPLEALPFPGVYESSAWIDAGHPLRPSVLLVKGVPVFGPSDPMDSAERWLDAHCQLASDTLALHDSGYQLKQRFLPGLGELPWRVETRRYTCTAPR